MTQTLLTALAFARHGYAVFPICWPLQRRGQLVCSCGSDRRGRPCGNAAKHPYGKLAPNGLLSATTETGIIKHWFGHLAPEANLGVRTDRLVVIDVDPRHGGDESFQALDREHGELPPTWRVLTGGGGEHLLFAAPDGVAIANVVAALMAEPPLGPGIDVRARGGYIVAPPSRHISGRSYVWSVDHHPQNVPLAPAPDWLIEKLTARTAETNNGTPVAPISSDIWAQLMTRNPEYPDEAAVKIAGHLFRHNCNYQVVLGLLRAWNTARCEPPLDEQELTEIVERIAVREAARIKGQL